MSNRLTIFLCGLLAAMIAMQGLASDTDEYGASDEAIRRHYLLQRLKLSHSAEVFDYCVDRYVLDSGRLLRCMSRQEKIRTGILDRAQQQLGLRSLAETLYFECRDYYPDQSIGRSGACVETRLLLRERLEQAEVEAEIYRRCDAKWRKHGGDAVKNCAISDANYYLQQGELPD